MYFYKKSFVIRDRKQGRIKSAEIDENYYVTDDRDCDGRGEF